jgi:AcrR family transcriptional regulator
MRPRGRPLTLSDDQLLDAARDVFLERGVDATTAEIAQRAKISESVIFYRHKTKEALFLAVFERELVLPRALEELGLVVGRGAIAEHLYTVGAAFLDLTESVLPFLMMAFSSSGKSISEHLRRPHPMRQRAVRLLTGYFEAEARCGRIGPADPEILARLFLGGVSQYVMAEYFERSGDKLPLPRTTYLRGMIDVLLNGAAAGIYRGRARKSARARRRPAR